jgi:hypothetical protein
MFKVIISFMARKLMIGILFIVLILVFVAVFSFFNLKKPVSINDFTPEERACSQDSDCVWQKNKECMMDFAVNKKHQRLWLQSISEVCLAGVETRPVCVNSICTTETVLNPATQALLS